MLKINSMAKVIVLKNPYKVRFPNQKDDLLKIMESETAPSKYYIWKTLDGYLFVYCDGKWIGIQKYINGDYACKWAVNPKPGCDCEETMDINELKQEILNYIEQNFDGVSTDLEQRLQALENKEDKDTIYNDSELRTLIQQLDAENNNFITAVDV